MALAPPGTAISVSAYASELGRALRTLDPAVVEGEVQRPRHHARGHLFFDLTDGEATLPCTIWGGQSRRLRHDPSEGDLVQVHVDRPDLWKAGGRLSLIASQVELTGSGELLRRRAELLRRLKSEGLCDPERRMPLPRFPRAVGVIAGRASDGMADVVRALGDRWPPVHIVTCASLVQGKAAPGEIVAALARLVQHPVVDVIVIARGGGSVSDLAAFDDEGLCRALFACPVPVVTAIGHTDNIPVCNYVTHAAFTPSRSAELVVPSAAEIAGGLAIARARLARLRDQLANYRARVNENGTWAARVSAQIIRRHDELTDHATRLTIGVRRHVSGADGGQETVARAALVAHIAAAARAAMRHQRVVLPTSTLAGERVSQRLAVAEERLRRAAVAVAASDLRDRGAVFAMDTAGRAVRSVRALVPGGEIALLFADGAATAIVTKTKEKSDD